MSASLPGSSVPISSAKPTVTAAFSEVYAERSLADDGDNAAPLRLALNNWWSGRRVQTLSRIWEGAMIGLLPLWLEGRNLPQTIDLAPRAKGIRLAGFPVQE